MYNWTSETNKYDFQPMQIANQTHGDSKFGRLRKGKCLMVIGAITTLWITLSRPFQHYTDRKVARHMQMEDALQDFSQFRVTKLDGIMYEIIGNLIYHDEQHFTQGLTYSRRTDSLYESNGLYGKSSICKLNPITGESQICVRMDDKYFGEGVQVYGESDKEKLIQLTWKESTGFIYDATTLQLLRNFTFTSTRNEGWGICIDEENHEFIISDGSGILHFMDVDTLQMKRHLPVKRQFGLEAKNINELEFYNGMILANVWHEDVILVIDPRSGVCISEYDLSTLWPAVERRGKGANVLNGISISKDDGILYVTGKHWDRMFKLKLRFL